MTKQEIIDFIREAIELKNKVEGVLTTTQYRNVEEFVDMCEDLENYICSLTKNKIPSELEYKLKNTGKYLHGQYNFIK